MTLPLSLMMVEIWNSFDQFHNHPQHPEEMPG